MVKTITDAVQKFAVWLVGLFGLSAAFADYVYVFFISILPIVELRGAIPVAAALKLNPAISFIVAVIGNLLPVPFILLLIKKVCEWMKTRKHLSAIPNYLERKVEKHQGKVTKYATWGLFIFVAIPLPGTGAWTGALIASFLNYKFKDAIVSITTGVLTAGVIMTLASYGVFEFITRIF